MNSKETPSNNDTSRIGYNNPYNNDFRLMASYDEYCKEDGTNFANQFRDDVDKNIGFMGDLKEKYGDIFNQIGDGMFVIKKEFTPESDSYIFSPHGIFRVYCPIILTTEGMSNFSPSVETLKRLQKNFLKTPGRRDLEKYTIYFSVDTYPEYIIHNPFKGENGTCCGVSYTRTDLNDHSLNEFIKDTFDTTKNSRSNL